MTYGYFIDNEAVKPATGAALTNADFMARFFTYLLCAFELIDKPKNTNYERDILLYHSNSNWCSYVNELL
jgi:hypothetical protein